MKMLMADDLSQTDFNNAGTLGQGGVTINMGSSSGVGQAVTNRTLMNRPPVAASYALDVSVYNAGASSHVFIPTLVGNITITALANPYDGQPIRLRFVQDATGGRTVTLPSNVVASGSLNTAANKVSWLNLVYVYHPTTPTWEGSWNNLP